MSSFDWGAFAAVLVQADIDIKSNFPLATSATSAADIGAALQAFEPKLKAADAWVKANPGYVRAAVRVLTELSRQGVTVAASAETAVSAFPGGLASADSWLPTIIGALTMFQPTPPWQPGPDIFHGR